MDLDSQEPKTKDLEPPDLYSLHTGITDVEPEWMDTGRSVVFQLRFAE
jgi:hypothetical protein